MRCSLHSYLSLELERLPQLVSVASLVGTVLCLSLGGRPDRRRSLVASCRQSWLRWCFFAGLLALSIGRVHLDQWRMVVSPFAHYTVPDNYCCTQAVLYAPGTAGQLADHLERLRCNETFHKDDALWSFGQSTTGGATRGVLVQPNLFKHVGLYSGLRGGFVDPHVFVSD